MRLFPFPCILTVKITDDMPLTTLGLTVSDQGKICVKLRPQATDGVLVHESAHVVQAVEEYIGGKLDDETFAYLSEYVFEKLKEKKDYYELHSKKIDSKNSK